MVSRVYTPLITPYNRPQGAGQNRGPVSSPLDDPPGGQKSATRQAPPQVDVQAEGSSARRPAVGLQAVQLDRSQKIPLDAVLHDFRNTINALGADDQTRAEVGAYLRVVSLQGAKDQPEIPFIKQTLRTAAGALDQYISKALGQPSQVVKEWVDALLLQDIDFHTDQPFADEPAPSAKTATDTLPSPAPEQPDEIADPKAQAVETNQLSLTHKTRLKTLIEQAKTEQQAGKPDAAQSRLQDALDLLDGKDHPEWEGKVWHLRGRFYDQSGEWEQAVHAYEQAVNRFDAAARPDKQAQGLQAAASILEEHGQMTQALNYYRQVVALDEQNAARTGDRSLLARSLNDLGSAYLRSGDAGNAVSSLEAAAQSAGQIPPKAASDIFSNLGAAHRSLKNYEQADQSYRQSLQAAKAGRDKDRYISTLQQMTTFYIEANRPEQAMKALDRLRQLQA
jgi:tetratricopeptide (TPR) repeat protein